MSRTTSVSMLQSKAREVQRHEESANRHEQKAAQYAQQASQQAPVAQRFQNRLGSEALKSERRTRTSATESGGATRTSGISVTLRAADCDVDARPSSGS